MRGVLLIFLFLSIIGKSQDPVISCSFEKMNVVYIGIPNPVTIAASGYQCEDLTVTGINCELTYKEPGKYDLITKGGAEAFVVVMSGGDTLGVEMFRVKRIPDPIPGFAGEYRGHYTQIPNLYFKKRDGFDYEIYFTVLSFTMSYQDSVSQEIKTISCKGRQFSDDAYEIYKKLDYKQKLTFHIKCKGPDNEERFFGPIYITKKNFY